MLSLGSQQYKQGMRWKSNFIFCWFALKKEKEKKRNREKEKENGIWILASALGNAEIH